jgi:AraC-like DNA-binding protein
MNMQQFPAQPHLAAFIKNYQIIETPTSRLNRVLPATSVVLALRFKGQVGYVQPDGLQVLPPAVVSGVQRSYRLIQYAPDTGTVLVSFTEQGAAAFLKASPYALFNQSVALQYLIEPPVIEQVLYRLAAAGHHEERVHITGAFLTSFLKSAAPDALVAEAIQRIRQSDGMLRMKDLAASVYLSVDAFEKRFRGRTGASPKQFAQIVRMRQVVAAQPPGTPIFDLACAADYYDQAHFHKHFRQFTGLSPTAFYESPQFW